LIEMEAEKSLIDTFEKSVQTVAAKLNIKDWTTPQLRQDCIAIKGDLVVKAGCAGKRRASAGVEQLYGSMVKLAGTVTHQNNLAVPTSPVNTFASPSQITNDKMLRVAKEDIKNRVSPAEILDLRNMTNPNKMIHSALIPVIILTSKLDPDSLSDWKKITDYLKKDNILETIEKIKIESIPADRVAAASAATASRDFNMRQLKTVSYPVSVLANWADAVIKQLGSGKGEDSINMDVRRSSAGALLLGAIKQGGGFSTEVSKVTGAVTERPTTTGASPTNALASSAVFTTTSDRKNSDEKPLEETRKLSASQILVSPPPELPKIIPITDQFKEVDAAKNNFDEYQVKLMRSFSLPPACMHNALIPIALLISNTSEFDLKSWDKVKDVLRKDDIVELIKKLDINDIPADKLERIRSYITSKDWDIAAIKKSCEPAALLATWLEKGLKYLDYIKLHPNQPSKPRPLVKAFSIHDIETPSDSKDPDLAWLAKEEQMNKYLSVQEGFQDAFKAFEEKEQAYKKAKAELNAKVSQSDIQLMKSFEYGPKALESVLPSVIMLVSPKTRISLYEWTPIRDFLRIEDLLGLIHRLEIDKISSKQIEEVREAMSLESWDVAQLRKSSIPAGVLASWVEALIQLLDAKKAMDKAKRVFDNTPRPQLKKPVLSHQNTTAGDFIHSFENNDAGNKQGDSAGKVELNSPRSAQMGESSPRVEPSTPAGVKVDEATPSNHQRKPMDPETQKLIETAESNKRRIKLDDIKNLRMMNNPPKEIVTAFTPIAMLLSKQSAQELTEWHKIKEILRKDNIVELIHGLRYDNLPHKRLNAVKSFVENCPNWHVNNFKITNLTASNVGVWVDTIVKAYDSIPYAASDLAKKEETQPQLKQSESKKNLGKEESKLRPSESKKSLTNQDSKTLKPSDSKTNLKTPVHIKKTSESGQEGELLDFLKPAQPLSAKAAGDALLVAGFLTYLPPLPFAHRRMLFEYWKFQALTLGIEFTPELQASDYLSTVPEKSMIKTHGNSLNIENTIIRRENKKATLIFEEKTK
jgi:hypothetical protein